MSPSGRGGDEWVLVGKHLLAGGVAGAVSRTVVSPLERLKILFQVQGPGNAKHVGVVRTLVSIYHDEGLRGYFKGNGTNVVRIAPYSAVQFASYEGVKKWLLSLSPNKKTLDTYETLFAGAIAGICSATSTYPLDMVRTRLSVQDAANLRYKGIADAMTIIYREEGGVLAWYRGVVPTVLGVAPYVAVNFTCYESLRAWFAKRHESGPTTLEKLFCGAVAGTTAQTFTYPMDVIRRRMQVHTMPGSPYLYKSTLDAFVTIVKKEGLRGLFKGMIPNYLKVAPLNATSFVTYELMKLVLKTS